MNLTYPIDASSVLEVIFRFPPYKGARYQAVESIRGNAEILVGLMKILSCGGTIDQAMIERIERLDGVERTLLAGWVSGGFQGKEIFQSPSYLPIEQLLSGKEFVHQKYYPTSYLWESYASKPDDSPL